VERPPQEFRGFHEGRRHLQSTITEHGEVAGVHAVEGLSRGDLVAERRLPKILRRHAWERDAVLPLVPLRSFSGVPSRGILPPLLILQGYRVRGDHWVLLGGPGFSRHPALRFPGEDMGVPGTPIKAVD
jgi:hypothetical protein